MKKLLILCGMAIVPMLAAENGAMTDSERAFLIEQLEKSQKEFLTSIEGLTAAQWKFKPGPDRWSVAECSEHIILAEEFIRGGAQALLKSPPADRLATANAEHDKKLAEMVADRTHKAKAPEPIAPGGTKFATPDDAAKEFIARRETSLEYVKTTQDELRVHVTQGPVGPMDAYDLLILMAAHTSRHTAQIREVQASPDYPKASAQVLH